MPELKPNVLNRAGRPVCGAPLTGRFRDECQRVATIERGGRWYCWTHDPQRIAEARRARHAANRARVAAQEAAWDAQAARRDMERAAGVRDLPEAALARLAALGGVPAILARIDRPAEPARPALEPPDLSRSSTADVIALMAECGASADPSDQMFARACRDELATRKPNQGSDPR